MIPVSGIHMFIMKVIHVKLNKRSVTTLAPVDLKNIAFGVDCKNLERTAYGPYTILVMNLYLE